MKRLIVFGIVAVVIWLMVQYPHVMLNPGELVEGHQKIKDSCLSCHKPFWGIDQEKCIACHKLSDIGKDSTNNKPRISFHQNLGSSECTSCHSDHKGIKPQVSISRFTHDILPETDRNKCDGCHNKPEDNLHKLVSPLCGSCHQTAGWKSQITFNHDMIEGTEKDNCSSCHKTPSDSFHSKFTTGCIACHNTGKWSPSTFNHDKYFRFDEHHPETCTQCHTSKNFSEYTCYGCHEHSASNIERKHYEHGISNFANCARCHRSGNEHDIEGGEGGEGQSGKEMNQNEKGKEHEGGEKDDD